MLDLRDPRLDLPPGAPERPDWDMVQIGLAVIELNRGDPRAASLIATLERTNAEVEAAYRRRCSER